MKVNGMEKTMKHFKWTILWVCVSERERERRTEIIYLPKNSPNNDFRQLRSSKSDSKSCVRVLCADFCFFECLFCVLFSSFETLIWAYVWTELVIGASDSNGQFRHQFVRKKRAISNRNSYPRKHERIKIHTHTVQFNVFMHFEPGYNQLSAFANIKKIKKNKNQMRNDIQKSGNLKRLMFEPSTECNFLFYYIQFQSMVLDFRMVEPNEWQKKIGKPNEWHDSARFHSVNSIKANKTSTFIYIDNK